jgi:processive 1,2-diacylglycerol beta-glucosyltransferase
MPVNTVVAYSPYRWDHALTVLRLVSPLQWAGLQLIHGNEKSDILPENISLGDAVVIQRDFPNYLEMYTTLVERARLEGKPVIYEIDDLLLELPDEHPDRSIGYYTPGLFSMLRAIIEADLVTTTTPALRAYLEPFNPNIIVLPNCLDEGIWTMSRQAAKPGDTPVVIGYMGSDTHAPDLETITPVLQRILARYGDRICLRFWGGEPPAGMREQRQVEWIKIEATTYVEFARFFQQQECDIFIAPLKDSLFNRCKSAIKYLEYSALGVPGVYSRITPYEVIVDHADNGFLASTELEWEECLVRLIESLPLRQHMGQHALATVQNHWLISQHAREWTQAYEAARQISSDHQAQALKQRYLQVFVRVANQVRNWQNNLYAQIQAKDQAIHDLEIRVLEAERFQNELKKSTAWKMVGWIWRLRSLLSPSDER